MLQVVLAISKIPLCSVSHSALALLAFPVLFIFLYYMFEYNLNILHYALRVPRTTILCSAGVLTGLAQTPTRRCGR